MSCKKKKKAKCLDTSLTTPEPTKVITDKMMTFKELKGLCDAAKKEQNICKAYCGGKFSNKKGCKGFKKANQVKCPKIKDEFVCAKIGCTAVTKKGKTKCTGKPQFG